MTTKNKTKKKNTTRLINVAPKQNQAVSQVVKIINPTPTKRRSYKRKSKQDLKTIQQNNPIQPIYIPSPQVLQPPQIQANVYDEAFKKAVLNLLNREIKEEDIKPKVKEEIKEVIKEVKEAKPAEIPPILEDAGKRNLNLPASEFANIARDLNASSEEFKVNRRDLGIKKEDTTPPRQNQHIRYPESPEEQQFYTPYKQDSASSSQADTPIPNKKSFAEAVGSPVFNNVNSPPPITVKKQPQEIKPFENQLSSSELAKGILVQMRNYNNMTTIQDVDKTIFNSQKVTKKDYSKLKELESQIDKLSIETLERIKNANTKDFKKDKEFMKKVDKVLNEKQKA